MAEPVAYPVAADRWLDEFLARCSDLYRSSARYRQRLNRERAPLFASANHNPPHLAA